MALTTTGTANNTVKVTCPKQGLCSGVFSGWEYDVPAELVCYAKLSILDKTRDAAAWSTLVTNLKFYVMKTYTTRTDKHILVHFAAVAAFVDVNDEINTNKLVGMNKRNYALLERSKNWNYVPPRVVIGMLLCMTYLATKWRTILQLLQIVYKRKGVQRVVAAALLVYLYGGDCVFLIRVWLVWFQRWHKKLGWVKADKNSEVKVEMSQLVQEVEDSASVSAMLEVADLVPSEVLPLGFMPVAARKDEFSRELFRLMEPKMGTDGWMDRSEASYIKPQFNGSRPYVEFPKIVCEKPHPTNESVVPLDKVEQRQEQPYYLIGPAFLHCLPGAHSNCQENELKSLCGRHLVYKHSDEIGVWKDVVAICLPLFKDMVSNAVPYSVDQWIMDQPPTKRAVYVKHRDRLGTLNFKDGKMHVRNFFIKDEILVPGVGSELKTKFPRGIQGLQKPETNLALGPFMHVVSKAVAASFGGRLSYTNGRRPEELGKWFHECLAEGYEFYEDDFSCFDSSQGAGCHYAEVAVYDLFGPDAVVKKALDYQARTLGFSRYYKYKTKYTRKSGDQNTSIGNTIINMMAHVYGIYKYNELGHNVEYRMLALGDDNLLAIKRAGEDFAEFMNTIVSSLGLVPKFIKCERAPTYCSAVFMPVQSDDGLTYLMVPELCRKLAKQGFTVSKLLKQETGDSRMKANELGAMHNALMPVSRIFNEHYVSLKIEASVLKDYKCHGMYEGNYKFCPETMEWFEQVYGLTSAEVFTLEQFLEEHLQRADGRPSVWNHPLAAKMYDHYRSA